MAKEKDKDKETVELLKEISAKLTALNDKRDDRNFQKKALKIQVKQGNIAMLISVVISVVVSFFIAFYTVSLTVDIPREVFNFVLYSGAIMTFVIIGVFCLMWWLVSYLQMREIDKLK